MDCIQVKTPLGTLLAEIGADPGRPSIWIELRRADGTYAQPLAHVYVDADDKRNPAGAIYTRVWADGKDGKLSLS